MRPELLETARSLLEDRYRCGGDVAQAVAGRAHYRDYQPRATIIAQGERHEEVYLTVAGHARAEALSITGRMAVLEDFFAGDFFGEGGLIEAERSEEEVRAVERVDAAVFANPAFVALLSNYADFSLAFSRMLVAWPAPRGGWPKGRRSRPPAASTPSFCARRGRAAAWPSSPCRC